MCCCPFVRARVCLRLQFERTKNSAQEMTCVEICARAVMCTGTATHCGTVVRTLLQRGYVWCYFNSDLLDDSDCSRMNWKQFSLRFSRVHRYLKYTWLPATSARTMLVKFGVGAGRDRKLQIVCSHWHSLCFRLLKVAQSISNQFTGKWHWKSQ